MLRWAVDVARSGLGAAVEREGFLLDSMYCEGFIDSFDLRGLRHALADRQPRGRAKSRLDTVRALFAALDGAPVGRAQLRSLLGLPDGYRCPGP